MCFVINLSLTYFAEISHAQYFTGPVASGLGGAGRGAADEGEQILLNPATIVHSSTFTSSLIYTDGYNDEFEHDKTLGLNLSDNSEDIFFAGGYAYFKRRTTFANISTREQDYHQVAIGKFIFKQVALGATVYYLKTDLIGDRSYDQIDGHFGIHYNPIADLGLGLVFYNVGSRDHKVPLEIQNLDKISFGAHYIAMPMFRLRLDLSQQQVQNPDNKIETQFGVESKIGTFTLVRMGWHDSPLEDRQFYSLGFGFDGPRLKIDYFYRHNVDYNGGAMHGVDMRMPFW